MDHSLTILLGALIRHILTGFGGYLVARGLILPGASEQFVGAGMLLAGIIWSWWKKIGHDLIVAWAKSNLRLIVPAVAGLILCTMVYAGISYGFAYPPKQRPANDIWEKIQMVDIQDLRYALALSSMSDSPQALVRNACWGEWIKVIAQIQGAAVGTRAFKQSIFSDFEQRATIAEHLAPTSPAMLFCAPAASLMGLQPLAYVQLIVGGSVDLSAFK